MQPNLEKFSQDKLKNSQLHRNRDFKNHFLKIREIREYRDQVFKKKTLGDLRASTTRIGHRQTAFEKSNSDYHNPGTNVYLD